MLKLISIRYIATLQQT